MKKNKILIGTRASKLAMIYANRAKNEISKVFSGEIELVKITTDGDSPNSSSARNPAEYR